MFYNFKGNKLEPDGCIVWSYIPQITSLFYQVLHHRDSHNTVFFYELIV